MFYNLWYNAPTMVPVGRLEAEFFRYQATGRQYRGCIYTTSCNTQSRAPEDGRGHRPKHVKLI